MRGVKYRAPVCLQCSCRPCLGYVSTNGTVQAFLRLLARRLEVPGFALFGWPTHPIGAVLCCLSKDLKPPYFHHVIIRSTKRLFPAYLSSVLSSLAKSCSFNNAVISSALHSLW